VLSLEWGKSQYKCIAVECSKSSHTVKSVTEVPCAEEPSRYSGVNNRMRQVSANIPTTWSQTLSWDRNSPYKDNDQQKCPASGSGATQARALQFKESCLQDNKSDGKYIIAKETAEQAEDVVKFHKRAVSKEVNKYMKGAVKDKVRQALEHYSAEELVAKYVRVGVRLFCVCWLVGCDLQ
jgi:hypothetical protein